MCWTCIRCGSNWGPDEAFDSHGLCKECLAELFRSKQCSKGYVPCFGHFKQWDMDCDVCSMYEACASYCGVGVEYEIPM